MSANKLHCANRRDRSQKAFVLAFDAYGSTRILAYADHLEGALDECVDWIAENKPGLLMDEAVSDAYLEARGEGMSEEKAQEEAEVDMTCAGNACPYLASWEWAIVGEDLTPAQISEVTHAR